MEIYSVVELDEDSFTDYAPNLLDILVITRIPADFILWDGEPETLPGDKKIVVCYPGDEKVSFADFNKVYGGTGRFLTFFGYLVGEKGGMLGDATLAKSVFKSFIEEL